MVDPGFPRHRVGGGRGANLQAGGGNLLFGQFFPEICMKMKEIGPGGGHDSPAPPPLDLPMLSKLGWIHLRLHAIWTVYNGSSGSLVEFYRYSTVMFSLL